MILDWPSDLPRPDRQGWQSSLQDARRQRQGDAGPPGSRRRFSSAARLVSLTLTLSRAQKAVFDGFFERDCALGAHLFRMPDPTTDGWAVLMHDGTPILTGSGAPLVIARIWLCAWSEQMPVETIVGTEFRVAFSVAVMP